MATLGLLAASLLIHRLLPFIAGERAGYLEDDSYFYAQIAFNSQKFGFFSFDGISPTSGFHLLWELLLSGVAHALGLFSQDKSLHLSVYLTLWFGILVFLSFRVGRTAAQRVTFFFLGMLTAPLMETALLSLLLVLGATELMKKARDSRSVGILLMVGLLIPLTRIDATPIPLLWVPLLLGQRRQAAAFVAAIFGGALLHFAFLQLYFGHLFSVSSVLKASSSLGSLDLFRSMSKVGNSVRMGMLLGVSVWGGTSLVLQKPQHRRMWLLLLGPPLLFSFGHAAVSNMRSWYYLPGYAFAFWVGAWGTEARPEDPQNRWASLPRHLGSAVAVMVLTMSIYKAYRFVPLTHVRVASWQFVEKATRLLPVDSRLYQVDGSGFTGYWLERHLINGDGLVNTFSYALRMREKRLAGYLNEKKVCYVITDAKIGPSQRFVVNQGGLKVTRQEADEVLRSDAYGWSKNPNAHFILWKLKTKRCIGE